MALEYVPDRYTTREYVEKWSKLILISWNVFFISVKQRNVWKSNWRRALCHWNMSLIGKRPAKRVKKLVKIILIYQDLFLIGLGHRKCVIKQLKRSRSQWNMFLVNKRPKRFVKELFKKILRRWNLFFIVIKP